ncbi:MAG: hypothetical protein HZT40_12200 [Candidatus Thiothrix singaporensis]|uniref:Uncharacterized protein n=1 Tax=Candidatus Thiothrix singaporensis TaxID=2799669 RepID=A0A7L6ASZ5_9GAMM|nr:MAG: hypothetical protein HZT40_12200 [Candidatus Thiothrix singaporensis]
MLKSTSPNLLMALAACLTLPAGAATTTMDSIYTSLEAKDCKAIASSRPLAKVARATILAA